MRKGILVFLVGSEQFVLGKEHNSYSLAHFFFLGLDKSLHRRSNTSRSINP